MFINGHGGNVGAIRRATELLVDEGRAVLAWHPRVPSGDSHAGRTETSLLLHLDPGCVRMERVEPGATARWREIGDRVLAEGLAAVRRLLPGDEESAIAAVARTWITHDPDPDTAAELSACVFVPVDKALSYLKAPR